jgi:tetratricopeptide (TPR) repeat protein
MISSTSLDLPDHREAAMDAVLRAGCFPLAMEPGSAISNSDAIRFSLDMVDQADLYVGIFAQRYGFIPDNKEKNPQGWSVTEHEYRRAKERRLPCLIYLDKDHKFSEEAIDFETEKRAKLEALKEDLKTNEICGFFSAPDKLHSLIIQSLFEEKTKHGSVAAAEPQPSPPLPQPPELYAVPPYTLTNEFVGRSAELAELDAWATSSDPVLVVEAIGGMGKSALTWKWTLEHAQAHISGLAGRVWWSFYERGTSMHTFLRHALAYVTRQDPETLRSLDTYDCGQQLLTELNRRPYLLVLDGFERVLTAYHRLDKAQMADDQVPVDERECTNPKDGDILRQLVHCSPSKVLVSSRLMPRALEDRSAHKPIPGVRHLELEGLAPADALAMVRRSGVYGDSAAILHFADQFDRHALVLRIVCGLITDFRPKPGDFDAWRADPYAGGGLKLSELPLKQRHTHILDFAFQGLAAKSRQLISRIAVLSDSANYATIAVLNPFQVLADFHATLSDLEDRGLLQWDRKANTYDLHPVVRAYAFEQLEERDRTGTYDAVRDHFASLPPENVEKATELTHVKNSIEIMRALIGSGRFEDALGFFRGKFVESLMISIGAYHVITEFLNPLLGHDQDGVLNLTNPADRSLATSFAAGALYYLDRNKEADQLYCDNLRLCLDSKLWKELATGLRSLGLSVSKMNRLASATRMFQLAYELAEAAGDEDGLTRSILDQMVAAAGQGQFGETEAHLTAFRQRKQPHFAIYRSGDAELCLAQSRFWQGRLTAEDLDHAERISAAGRNLVGQHRLAALRAEWELTRGNPTTALESIEQALAITRRTGVPALWYLGLRALALARLGRTSEAHETLVEAEEVWGGLTPSFPVVAAETWLTLCDRERARELIRRAYPLAWADGSPHIHWYELKRCREIMAELGEPEPQLPPFDPAKVESIPYEVEIRALIKKLKAKEARKKTGRGPRKGGGL